MPRRSAGTEPPCPPVPSPVGVESVLAHFPLRDYQGNAARAFLAKIGDRSNTKVVQLPTGTGKTWVGVATAACLLKLRYNILWVCKRWKLLDHAAAFSELLPNGDHRLRQLGDELNLARVCDSSLGQVVFTTLQTWHARRRQLPAILRPSANLAVIWDEVDWGFHSPIGRAFRGVYRDKSSIQGLSATCPTGESVDCVYERMPDEFFGTILAAPHTKHVATHVEWSPRVRNGEFTPDSLGELARNAMRNTKIADTVAELRASGRATSVILFAANIPHCAELARLISARGVPARALHSRLSAKEQDEAEELFRAGKIDILVNVGQLVEGFDHPPVDAVLLARPTQSARLMIQMIGRGARKAPGKDTFRVVDFVDNLTRHGEKIIHGESLFPSLKHDANRVRAYRPPVRYIKPTVHPEFENYVIPNSGTIRFQRGLTFGIEIELTGQNGVPADGPTWRTVALAILETLRQFVTAPVHPEPLVDEDGPLDRWRVVYDASAGWEIVSPILVDAAGLDELSRACRGVEEAVTKSDGDLRVNHRTGMHVTLATSLDTDDLLKGCVKLVQRLEPGLFTLVAPSRLYPYDSKQQRYARRAGNCYCRPLRQLADPAPIKFNEFVRFHKNRYRTVNFNKSKDAVPLLEIRMHGGTYDFAKIALWTSLWMQIFHAARRVTSGAVRPGLVLPGRNRKIAVASAAQEDIIALLRCEGVALPAESIELLRRRRAELRPVWEKVIPSRVAKWAAAGWYDRGTGVNPLKVEVKTPLEWSADELKSFEGLIRSSGVVEPDGLSGHLVRATALACVRDGDTMVAVTGVKNPQASYRSKIESRAGFVLAPDRFPHELGWFYVRADYRDRGLSTLLAEKCLASLANDGVFATVHEANEPMKRTLLGCGFRPVGAAYPSVTGGGNLVLVVREAG